MGAGEDQPEPVVGDSSLAWLFTHGQFFGKQPYVASDGGPAAPTPLGVDRLAARDGQQPGFRFSRNAPRRPVNERRRKSLRQSVLSGCHVVPAMREEGDQLAIATPCCRVGGGTRFLVAVPQHRGSALRRRAIPDRAHLHRA
jgi:hypothetical protein